jgi:hypothetical protein
VQTNHLTEVVGQQLKAGQSLDEFVEEAVRTFAVRLFCECGIDVSQHAKLTRILGKIALIVTLQLV